MENIDDIKVLKAEISRLKDGMSEQGLSKGIGLLSMKERVASSKWFRSDWFNQGNPS
jgi:hypothetical protein